MKCMAKDKRTFARAERHLQECVCIVSHALCIKRRRQQIENNKFISHLQRVFVFLLVHPAPHGVDRKSNKTR